MLLQLLKDYCAISESRRLETIELKFLLKLLGFSGYRAPLAKITPSSKTSVAERERISRKLCDRELVDLQRKYLPLFYLREKLQPPLSREDLDRSLFRLENKGHIELSAVTRGWRYSEEELNAGIPQRAGSRLFFVNLK